MVSKQAISEAIRAETTGEEQLDLLVFVACMPETVLAVLKDADSNKFIVDFVQRLKAGAAGAAAGLGAAGTGAWGRITASTETTMFWKLLPSASLVKLEDGMEFIQLPAGVQFPGSKKWTSLLRRRCYRVLSEKIRHSLASAGGSRHFIILGTPGIGKTNFLFDLLYELACAGKTVVWNSSRRSTILLFTPSGVYTATSLAAFETELQDPRTWFLSDAVEPPDFKAITVLASSPRISNYNSYIKEDVMELWMGPWSLPELKAARDNMYKTMDDATLQRLYARWGGIPRYVLEYATNEAQQRKLDAAVATAAVYPLLSALSNIQAAPEVSHKLIHVQVDADCRMESLVFGSEEIGQRVLKELQRNGGTMLDLVLTWSAGKPELATLRGKMFQAKAHDTLCKGGTFRVRCLSESSEQTPPLEVPRVELKDVQDFRTAAPGSLLVPMAKNFPAVDSLLILPGDEGKPARLLFFQLTIGSQHSVTAPGMEMVVQQLPSEFQGLQCELYFVVPPDLFESYRRQPYKSAKSQAPPAVYVKQFVLEIPIVGFDAAFADKFPDTQTIGTTSASSTSTTSVGRSAAGGSPRVTSASRSHRGIIMPGRSLLPQKVRTASVFTALRQPLYPNTLSATRRLW